MLHSVRNTSREAYEHVLITGKDTTQRGRIYAYISSNLGCTRRQISRDLALETASVSARVNALVKEGQVVEGETVKDITGRSALSLWIPSQLRLL